MRHAWTLLGLAVGAAVGSHPLATQARSRDELPIRSWAQEMREKAEASLYRRRDCRAALQQADAAYRRELRHPERMQPRTALVKARAHDCLEQLPQAVLAFALYGELSNIAPADNLELAGACGGLFAPERAPASDAERRMLLQRLASRREAIREVVARAHVHSGGGVPGWAEPEPRRGAGASGATGMESPADRLRSEGERAALWVRYWNAYRAPPAIRTGHAARTTDGYRHAAASEGLGLELAHLEARLTCLQSEP